MSWAATALAVVMTSTPSLKEDLELVARSRVVFGHQSVGGNLLDGVAMLAKEEGVALRVVQGRDAALLAEAGLVHDLIGENEDPSRKVKDFGALVTSLGPGAQVAAMKLCYVDFDQPRDPDALLAEYQREVAALRAKLPGLTVLHVTAPLTIVQSGLKAVVKDLIGKGRWGRKFNIARHAFNEKLRAAVKGEPLFDLAEAEAGTGPGRCVDVVDGREIPCLRPELSDDGGHLNARGQREVARAFVTALAAALRAPAR